MSDDEDPDVIDITQAFFQQHPEIHSAQLADTHHVTDASAHQQSEHGVFANPHFRQQSDAVDEQVMPFFLKKLLIF